MENDSTGADTKVLLEFMFRLGQAILACGEQTAKVELMLRRTASAYGARRSRVVAFPTAVFISVHDGRDEHVTFAEGPTETLRLDQIADVYALGEDAQRAAVSPSDGLKRLSEILKKSPRFGWIGVVVGHTILTVGVAILFMPTTSKLLVVAALGLAVGVIKLWNRGREVLAVPLPAFAAAFVSVLVFLCVSYGLSIEPLHALVPPLVTFLPGGMLTMGMVELAYGDMVGGSSRLMTGLVQLVLLSFGLVAGAVLVGYRPENLTEISSELGVPPTAPWLSWMGVAVFGTGAFLHFSAPRNSLRWMLLVLFCAFAAQQLAAVFFGPSGSGFFGMLVATPLGYLIQLRFKGPPAMVTFLPSFWLLVPGALSLVSVNQMLHDRAAGLDGLVSSVFAVTSIALGTLMGAAVYKLLTERFGAWQLQIGRASSHLRRRRRE